MIEITSGLLLNLSIRWLVLLISRLLCCMRPRNQTAPCKVIKFATLMKAARLAPACRSPRVLNSLAVALILDKTRSACTSRALSSSATVVMGFSLSAAPFATVPVASVAFRAKRKEKKGIGYLFFLCCEHQRTLSRRTLITKNTHKQEYFYTHRK